VSKAPAKSAAPPKKAVRKPAAVATRKPVATKPAPKPAAKAVPKPAAKSAASATTPAKPASKAVAAKAPAPPPIPKPVTAKTNTKIAPPATPAPATAKPATRAASKNSARMAQAVAPMPEPAQASRFADRFAPMRPSRPVAMDAPVRAPVKFDPKLSNAWKSKSGRDLSEPELLAMPEAEYMNEKQLEFFRARLTVLKDDLLSNAGETTEHLREDTSIVPDPADRATIEEEHALELRTRDRERKLLKKISQSLSRIEAGEYGYCDETGEPIGLARLLARPTATLSLEAQQRREMKQKMFGD
jgi:DnaK suppressor protein